MTDKESTLLEQDREPVVAICLRAALADSARTPEEQQQLTRIAARLGEAAPAALLERAQQGKITVADAARRLSSPEARREAYEMAVAVVYADGEAGASGARLSRGAPPGDGSRGRGAAGGAPGRPGAGPGPGDRPHPGAGAGAGRAPAIPGRDSRDVP